MGQIEFKNNFKQKFNRYNQERKTLDTQSQDVEFMGNIEVFPKMKSKMQEIASRIRKAINDGQRIILKHHNDTDGYCTGIVLESAILPLIAHVSEKKQAVFEKFRRMSSQTPFYNVEDSSKDVAQFLSLKTRFNEIEPLVILTDLGSGPENKTPIEQLKIFGCEVIVIDHHPVNEDVDKLIDFHLNPQLFGADIQDSAGIYCAEIARMINPKTPNTDVIAAVSCTKGGDRVSDDIAQPYYELAQKQGYTKEDLENIARCIDFSVSNLRGIEVREYYDTLFTKSDKQKNLVTLLTRELDARIERILTQAKELVSFHETNTVRYMMFPVSDVMMKDFYPRLGAMVGIVHDKNINTELKPLITLGTTSNSITFRAEERSPFDFPKMLAIIQEKVPLAFADGGGHTGAGTYRCSEKYFDKVLTVVKEYLESL